MVLSSLGQVNGCRLLAACLLVMALASRSSAQNSDSAPLWQAMRVYVPEDQVDAVVTPDYLTIDIDDLERLLSEEAQRRAQSAVQAVGIQRAVYLARWNGHLLTSSASMWEVTLPDDAQPLSIGRTSLPIDEPAFLPADGQSLMRYLRYLDEARLQLAGPVEPGGLVEPGGPGEQTSPEEQAGSDEQANFWFGFKAKTRRGEAGGQSVDLVLPRAALATMLIAVPANSVIQSNLPCARTDDPSKFLPARWPREAFPERGANEHWYVVHLSGREACSLQYVPATEASQFPYRMSVTSSQCDLSVTPAGLQANCRFQLPKAPVSNAVRLRIEEPLHVRTVQINGIETTYWRTIADEAAEAATDTGRVAAESEPPQSHLIEITLPEPIAGPLILGVEAIAQIPLNFQGSLPRVEVANAFVLDGRGTLTSAENVQIEDVISEAQRLSTTSNGGYPAWQWQWTGKTPVLHAKLRASTNQWTVRSLTRFSVQTNVIVATAHIQLNSVNIQGNQVALKLAKGWFVDSVELEHAPPGVSASVRGAGGEEPQLSVRWEESRKDLDVRIAVSAHFPQRTEVDSLRLQSTRIVTLPGADQVDTYVVESSGRFQMEIDPELLRLRIREEELLQWQRELLPRLVDVWIFRGTRGSLPSIRLERMRATLKADLQTMVTQHEKETVVSYRVQCKPISGSIDQIRLLLPIPADVVAPTWTLVPAADGSLPRGLLITSRATSTSAGETAFTIELSQDMAGPLEIEAELRLEGSGALTDIPLPSIPQAVTQEALVVVPASLALPQDVQGLEILPDGMCCADGKLVAASGSEAAEVIAARYDPNLISHLQVQPSPENRRGAWVREQLHEHWHHSGGRALHRTTWDIALPSQRTLEFSLPADWQFAALSINDRLVDLAENTGDRVRVHLPEGSSVRVGLECSSRDENQGWGSIRFAEPDCGLPVLSTRRVAWFSGTVIAGQGWLGLAQASQAQVGAWPARVSWAQRLLPSAWWHWLSMDPWAELADLPTFPAGPSPSYDSHPLLASTLQAQPLRGHWWALELANQPAGGAVWHAERSLVVAFLLAITLVAAVMIYWLCSWHIARWWGLWTVVLVGLCIVPVAALPLVQLLALALVSATLVRISVSVMQRSNRSAKSRDGLSPSGASLRRTATGSGLGLVLAAALGNTAWAQPLSPADMREREKIFGILIPVDSDFKVAGDYVYVPTRLSRLLSNSHQQENENASVAVQSAFYSLRVSNDQVTMASSIGELTAELTVHSPRVDAELRLPFSSQELKLQRAFLDSQELFLSERLKQEGDSLVWRAGDADRHTLRLIFRPTNVVEKEGRGLLSVGIPPIPTSKLEVMGDDLRDVTVEAIGGTQMESPRFLSAQLGPTNRLVVSWPLSLNRSATVQVQSDTWIHTRGQQVIAQCQLRLRGATALPSVLHVVGDNNWQPVGQDWEDGRLIAAEGASTSGRPVYSVQRTTDSSLDTLTIRVLLLPRDDSPPQSLSIPFLALQEAASQARTLAISHAESPQWKPVGTEPWQPDLSSRATVIWEKGRLAEQPTLLRVPVGTVIATLQHSPPPSESIVDELTEISLHLPDVKVKYEARWSQPIVGQSAMRFHVPSGLRVDAAFVDNLPARHTAQRLVGPNGEGLGTHEIVVFVDGARGGMQSVILQLSTAARLNRPWRLPRPLALGSKVNSSVVQIYRGAELSSKLQVLDSADIEFEKVEVRPSPLLDNLHTVVGQAELGDRFRESAELPVEVRLGRTPANRNTHTVMRLMRSDQGWKAQIDALIDVPDGEVNHVFFDLPSGLLASFREPLEHNAPFMLWPSADTNREILCVLPQLGSDGKAHVSLTVRLPSAGASQSISIPDIRVLDSSMQRPVLALPTTIAGQEVRWSRVGRPQPEKWIEAHGLERLGLEGFTLHEPSASQFQAMWHSRQSEEQTAQVLLTRAWVHADQNGGCSGEVRYWVDPRNQTYLTAKLPPKCELVGAQLGSRPVAWSEAARREIRVLLQPSYLPVQLRLFLRWPEATDDSLEGHSLELPLPELDARDSGSRMLGLPRTLADGRLGRWHVADANELSAPEHSRFLAQAWANLLVQSAATAADRQTSELGTWLPTWRPEALGLSEDETIMAPPIENELIDESESLNVADFWEKYVQLLQLDPEQLASRANPVSGDQVETRWFQLNTASENRQLSIASTQDGRTEWIVPQPLVAAGLLFLSALAWFSTRGRLGKLLSTVAEAVWPVWLALAAVTWLFLPVAWPSMVISLCVLIVLWRRYRELKRDHQFVVVPRAVR